MNKHATGTYSQLLAAAFFVKHGWDVSFPITDFGEYDLIIVGSGVQHKVQVKTAYWDNSKNRYLVSFVTSHIRGNERRTNKKYTKDSFDLLVAVEHKSGFIYQWNCSEVVGKRSRTVYPEKAHEIGRIQMFD